MKFYLTEKIGNPELFTGRKKELAFLLKWVARIKRERSKSTAVLSRRKTGKSALMQRLYNIVFHNDDGVVPFYFEIRETDQWLGTFCEDFFLTFIYQYIAFKTRDKKYLTIAVKKDFEEAVIICREKGLDYLVNLIEEVHSRYRQEDADAMWDLVRDAPRKVAEYKDESVVQMIDEFQHINRFIFKDKEGTRRADKLAGSYLHTAEYRNAPLLISGSWIGWLMNDLITLLPGRFKTHHLQNVPEDEAIEMIFKYSLMAKVPVTEQTVFLIARLTEGNPFYISVLFDSNCPEKDLATEEGVLKTLEFETLHISGKIRGTWLEYIHSAFPRINEKYAKD
ncbi:MAG: hypothetical protein GY862_07320, partial [Gammaproteobacteria bacterium]|nr:hypothetical protein [Gammaproteobacteria bacterium]